MEQGWTSYAWAIGAIVSAVGLVVPFLQWRLATRRFRWEVMKEGSLDTSKKDNSNVAPLGKDQLIGAATNKNQEFALSDDLLPRGLRLLEFVPGELFVVKSTDRIDVLSVRSVVRLFFILFLSWWF